MCEVIIGETSVKLKKGDITAEKTDAIVNLNNTTLNRNIGVSRVILTAAGNTVKEECARLAKLPNNGCVVTPAGNLECQKIIHLIYVTPATVVESVKKALKVCDQHKMATLSLPAIGTGASNLDPKNSIKLIMKGLEEYLVDPAIITMISEINIVVFESDTYQEYLVFFNSYKTYYHHFTAFGKTIELIKGDITDQNVDCILNLTNRTLNRSRGVSGAILSAAGDTVMDECKAIGVLGTDGIAITSGGNTKSKNIMHILGRNNPDFERTMDRVLLECHKNGFTSFAIPAIGTGMARIDPEQTIKAILSSTLNYLSDILIPTLETISIIVLQEDIHKTYLKIFQEKCVEIQELQREEQILSAIQAQVKIDYPKTWTNISEHEYQEVTLATDSQEFKDVESKFLKSAGQSSIKISEITRIQNNKLWQSFTVNKQAVDRKNPGARNIHHLYHGTTPNVTADINRRGFNRIYHGKNGIACGTGTYFAVASNYSCGDKYAVPNSNDGTKYVYQAAVITGRYCQGRPTYKDAPYINNDPSGERYESVVNRMVNPTYFVVFHDDYAYPEYLITLTVNKP